MARKKNTKSIIAIFLVLFILVLIFIFRILTVSTIDPFPEYVYVSRVVDGDTFVDAGKKRYRLLLVDTPELKRKNQPEEAFAKEATEFTKSQIEHKKVKLEYEKNKYDRFNRLLVYVYTPEGKMLNKLLIEEGYAEVYRKQQSQYKKLFYELQNKAIKDRKGIWKDLKNNLNP